MKALLLVTSLVLGVAAQAAPLKAYDCKAAGQGSVTPDAITVQANQETLVFSFPGWSAADYAQPVAERVANAGDNGYAVFDLTKNSEEFLVGYNAYAYNITQIKASNGLMRGDASGTVTISYDDKASTSGSWERAYGCKAK